MRLNKKHPPTGPSEKNPPAGPSEGTPPAALNEGTPPAKIPFPAKALDGSPVEGSLNGPGPGINTPVQNDEPGENRSGAVRGKGPPPHKGDDAGWGAPGRDAGCSAGIRMILVVEDNPDDMELALRALKKSGQDCMVETASDGVEALDFLFCRGEHRGRDPERMPEIILLDLKMPRMDGLEVLERLRDDRRTRYIPVVVITTSMEERDLLDSYERGANSYIRKPVDFNRFTRTIDRLGYYWLMMNEPAPCCGMRSAQVTDGHGA